MNRAFWYAVAAYSIWGLFPIYWKLITHVPATELLAHRIIWSFLALVILTASLRRADRWPPLSAPVLAPYALAAVLIGFNWFVYVWAVAHGYLVEASLGYFITPLVSVLLGVVALRERLRARQWVAVALAAAGVAFLTRAYGALPWVSLALASTFGCYGLVKKKAMLAALPGLTLETGVLLAPAILYLFFRHAASGLSALAGEPLTAVLIAGTGVLTIGPLLLFASAVQRVPLSVVGLLQYISPTIQFLLGVFVYREGFSRAQLAGFCIIWAALIVFAADGVLARRPQTALGVADAGTP